MPSSGKYGPLIPAHTAILRYTTPFYYRQLNHRFRVTAFIDKNQLIAQDIIVFSWAPLPSILVEPTPVEITASELPPDGRIEFNVIGTEIGATGKIIIATGPYAATCEIVIAAEDTGKGFGQPSGKPPAKWDKDNAAALFIGYELRNLDNDIDRAVYQADERLILINTEAPTGCVFMWTVKGISEMAHASSSQNFFWMLLLKNWQNYTLTAQHRRALAKLIIRLKQTFVKRFGVEIHQIMMGG